jgi:hypothetical protein
MTMETKRACVVPKAQRVVSFSPNVMVQFTTHTNDFRRREIRACWYTKSEYKDIRKEIRMTLDLMEQNVDIDDYNHCKRGLEYLTKKGAHERMQTKLEAWAAVFEEQDLQDAEGIVDPEILAIVYNDSTRSCRVAAYITGVLDKWAALASAVGSEATSRKKSDRFRLASISRAPPRSTISLLRWPIAA